MFSVILAQMLMIVYTNLFVLNFLGGQQVFEDFGRNVDPDQHHLHRAFF